MTKICWQTIRSNVRLIIGLVLAIAASIGVNVAPPLILQYIVDSLAGGHFTAMPLLMAGIIYFAVNAGSGLVDALKETLITIFGQKITHSLRSAMCRRLDSLPAPYFVSHESGAVTSLFVNDVDTLEDLFDSGVVSMIADVLTIFSILVVVFHLSPGLGILLCIALPLLFILTRYFQKRMLKQPTTSAPSTPASRSVTCGAGTDRRSRPVFPPWSAAISATPSTRPSSLPSRRSSSAS